MVSNVLNNVCLCGSGERGARRTYCTDGSKPVRFTFVCDKLGGRIKKAPASFVSSAKITCFETLDW